MTNKTTTDNPGLNDVVNGLATMSHDDLRALAKMLAELEPRRFIVLNGAMAEFAPLATPK